MLERSGPRDRVHTARLKTHCRPCNRALETTCSLGGNRNLEDLACGSILTSELMSPHGRDFGITLFVLECRHSLENVGVRLAMTRKAECRGFLTRSTQRDAAA